MEVKYASLLNIVQPKPLYRHLQR